MRHVSGEKRGERYTEYYDCLGDVLDRVTQDDNPIGPKAASWETGDRDRDKHREGTWEQIITLARHGWPEGRDKLVQYERVLTDIVSGTIERFDPYYSEEANGNLDVARYLDGEPECWIRLDSITTTGLGLRHLTIVLNCSASWNVDTEVIIARGATTVSLIQCLELAGHRVRVLIGHSVGETSKTGEYDLYIQVKGFEETMDIDRLTFALAHPGMLRGLVFGLMERLPEKIREKCRICYGRGYGIPCDIADKGDIYIGHASSGGGHNQWQDPEKACQWIRDRLEEQGIMLKEEG